MDITFQVQWQKNRVKLPSPLDLTVFSTFHVAATKGKLSSLYQWELSDECWVSCANWPKSELTSTALSNHFYKVSVLDFLIYEDFSQCLLNCNSKMAKGNVSCHVLKINWNNISTVCCSKFFERMNRNPGGISDSDVSCSFSNQSNARFLRPAKFISCYLDVPFLWPSLSFLYLISYAPTSLVS